MLAQLGWFAAGFVMSGLVRTKIEDFMEQHFAEEVDMLRDAKADFNEAKRYAGESVKKKMKNKDVDLEEALQQLGNRLSENAKNLFEDLTSNRNKQSAKDLIKEIKKAAAKVVERHNNKMHGLV